MTSRSKLAVVFWLLTLALPLTNIGLLFATGSIEGFRFLDYTSVFDAVTLVFGALSIVLIPGAAFLCLALLSTKRDLNQQFLYSDRTLTIYGASCFVGIAGPWFLIWFFGWLFQFTDMLVGVASMFILAPCLACCVIIGAQVAFHLDRGRS